MPFFEFNEFIKKYKIPFWKKSCCIFLLGERNCGKTTSPLEIFMSKASETNKILYCRNTQEQLRKANQDFNVRFAGRFQIYGSMIWKLQPLVAKDKNGEDYEIFKRTECVGYAADLNNYHNYKSVQAKDVNMIFFDEVIQLDNITGFYEKLVNLFMTFVRFNKTSILLIGNRDSANNELMVNWDIPAKKEAPKEDEIINVTDNIWFCNLGTEQFKDLYSNDKDNPHIIKSLASLNTITNAYINEGGYLHDFSLQVINFKRNIQSTFEPYYLINYLEKKAAIGKFGEDKLAMCISPEAVQMAEEQGLRVIPIDTMGFLISDSDIVSQEKSEKILRQLLLQYKKENLYFDSFEVLDWLKKKMCFRF